MQRAGARTSIVLSSSYLYAHQKFAKGARLLISLLISLVQEVYEGRYASDILNEELIKRLTNDLRRRIDNHPEENNSLMGGFADLRECIFNYSSQEFAKSFGFEYSKNAKPPQTRPGGKVAIYEALFNFREFPATKDNVKSWIDAELFE